MKNIIEYILEIITHEQKIDLWEEFNGATFSETDFEIWIDYYLEHENDNADNWKE
jgi:hypothetical protein